MHEPLSERELTVLRYLPTLLSSSEIAGELFVTVNTVKSHLKSIYRKLEVSSRREAVRAGARPRADRVGRAQRRGPPGLIGRAAISSQPSSSRRAMHAAQLGLIGDRRAHHGLARLDRADRVGQRAAGRIRRDRRGSRIS